MSVTGTLQPWATVDIKSKAGGRVNALLVDVGSVITKGQIIARIDPSDTLLSVSTAQAQIAVAVAHTQQSKETYPLQLQQSRIVAAIAQAQANYNAAVKDRQGLDATIPQDRASAQAAYDQAVANQKNAKAGLARQAALVQKGYVAQQEVDTAQATYDVDVATVQSALEKLRTISAQQAGVQSADANVAQAALTQAQANLANNGIKHQDVAYNSSVIKSSQAALTNAKTTLQQTVVRAPSEGVVLSKAVSEGTYITSGQSQNAVGFIIITLGDISQMYV